MTDNSHKAVNNVNLELSVVLGRAKMPIHQLLKMGRGAVIELDTNVDDPALIMANDKLIAEGEVMIAEENVAVTITRTVGKLETN
ncbi:FliM/FliN family flagellar motor switch protein [Alphaproteobacteria bacterium]|nr:FliM/FliN family flagellar motor switch protein [Alphaproteobacteria bacterium]